MTGFLTICRPDLLFLTPSHCPPAAPPAAACLLPRVRVAGCLVLFGVQGFPIKPLQVVVPQRRRHWSRCNRSPQSAGVLGAAS